MICGIIDIYIYRIFWIILNISICFIRFIFLIIFSIIFFFRGLLFLIYELVYFFEFEILSLNSTSIVITVLLDWIRLLFISFVLLISRIVILYREEYIKGDNYINRFIILVLLFVLSIIIIIIRPNLIRILLGWDGLGLISYCLVIYFQNVKSFNAGMLTALSNRIGDVALLMAITWILNYGRWRFIYYIDFMRGDFIICVIGILIVLAAITKRAQIPFSSWLPAAIAAPTPVSALVHSSTLVTAGVYLLIRFNILLTNNSLGQFILLISGLTIFISGLGANFEFDLKKIIALSTLSQLGLIIIILSMGFYKLAFFHLLTHAIFKALLFICAGSIIHNIINSQDIRFIGGLSQRMPFTSSFFNISNLALCGIPFLAGFYSKDLILEISLYSYLNFYIIFIFFFSTGLTVSYSFRLVYYSMVGDFNINSFHPINDEGWLILKIIISLVLISIICGSLLRWLIFPTPYLICLPLNIKLLTILICFMGGFIGYTVSNVSLFSYNKSLNLNYVISFISLMWFLPVISTNIMCLYPLKLGNLLKGLDQGWREFFGAQNLFKTLILYTKFYQFIHFNRIKLYLISFIIWFIVLIIIFSLN